MGPAHLTATPADPEPARRGTWPTRLAGQARPAAYSARALTGQVPVGRVRVLYGAVPAPYLLLPGGMWVGRAASVSEKAAGEGVVQAPGAARPARPTAARFQVPSNPAAELPKTTTDPAAPMTEETCTARRTPPRA